MPAPEQEDPEGVPGRPGGDGGEGSSPFQGDGSPSQGDGSPSQGDGSPSQGDGSPSRGEGNPARGEAGGTGPPGRNSGGAGPPGDNTARPAYYAARRPGGWRDWWTLLHPPYTAWHLSYVVIGAALAPQVQASRLIATILAFFLAVGLAAHALDELRGRPLRTQIPAAALLAVVAAGLAGALVLGVLGVSRVGWTLVPYMVAGPVLVIAYNAELFGGLVHTDFGFAAAWGAFPVLTAYTAQTGTLALAPVLAAVGAFALSAAQRQLSTPARAIRRRASRVEGSITFGGGGRLAITEDVLLLPLERALRATSWAIILLAAALAVARLT